MDNTFPKTAIIDLILFRLSPTALLHVMLFSMQQLERKKFILNIISAADLPPSVEAVTVGILLPDDRILNLPRTAFDNVDPRFIALFELANTKSYTMDSIRATTNLWHGRGFNQLLSNPESHSVAYTTGILSCYPESDKLEVLFSAYETGMDSGIIGLHATVRTTFAANVSCEWFEKAYPDNYRRLAVGQELGLLESDLSIYVCSEEQKTEFAFLPADLDLC